MEALLIPILLRARRAAIRTFTIALVIAGAIVATAALTGCGSKRPSDDLLPPSRGVIVPARLYDSEQVLQLLLRADPDVQAIYGTPAVFTWEPNAGGVGGRQSTLYPIAGSSENSTVGRAVIRSGTKENSVWYSLTQRNHSGTWEISGLTVDLSDREAAREGVSPRHKTLAGQDFYQNIQVAIRKPGTEGKAFDPLDFISPPESIVLEPGTSAEAKVMQLLAADSDVCALFGGKADFKRVEEGRREQVGVGQSTLYPLLGSRRETAGGMFFIEGPDGRRFAVSYSAKRHNDEPEELTSLNVSLLDDATHQKMPLVTPEQKRLVGNGSLIGPLRGTDQEIKAWEQWERTHPSDNVWVVDPAGK